MFTAAGYYFVVPLFAPIVGCTIGAMTYDGMLFEGEGSRVTDALDKAEEHGSLRLQ